MSDLSQPLYFVGRTDAATTGLSRYARSLYGALAERGVTVEVVGAKPPPLPSPLYTVAREAGFDLRTFFSTYPAFLPDIPATAVVHLMSQGQAGVLAWRPRPRTVVTVHDLITTLFRKNPELTGYMRSYDKFFDDVALRGLRNATALLADSAHTRYDIINHLHYPPERVHVVHVAVDHSLFRPVALSDDFYVRYNLDKGRPYLLYVGSEDPRKNLHRLIAAFQQVSARFPEVHLLKVGGGRFAHERENLLAKVKNSGMITQVRIIDQVSDSDLTCFYNLASAFVFPSLYEGFGLPPLEAMACGTPVITAHVASLPEVVGDAALLVDPYDIDELAHAMMRVISESTLRSDLRERGLARAAEFTWARTVDQTLAVYKTLT